VCQWHLARVGPGTQRFRWRVSGKARLVEDARAVRRRAVQQADEAAKLGVGGALALEQLEIAVVEARPRLGN